MSAASGVARLRCPSPWPPHDDAEEEHPCLEWGYADRLQTSSELAVQLQHQFQECQRLRALVLDSSHGQCVVPFAMRSTDSLSVLLLMLSAQPFRLHLHF